MKGKENKHINISEVAEKHDDDTICIVGTGPSLSSYPDNFIDDKQSMTLHMAFLKFPLTKYAFFTEADRFKWVINNREDFSNTKVICSDPLFPLSRPSSIYKTLLKNTPIHIPYSPFQLPFNKIELMVKSALARKSIRYQSNQTVLHNAIWASIILGFKTIKLIGCDQRQIKGDHYFATGDRSADLRQSAPDRARDDAFFKNIYDTQNIYLKEIKKICFQNGIIIERYENFASFDNNSPILE